MRQILKSEKGLTLTEVLVSFVIFCLIAVIIIGYLVSSINNFKRINEEIALHDEANFVMSRFVNYIFVATKVKKVDGSETLIRVTDYKDDEAELGFKENAAVINGEDIHSDQFSILSSEPNESKIDIVGDTVKIKMFIKVGPPDKPGKILELNSEVSFVNVE